MSSESPQAAAPSATVRIAVAVLALLGFLYPFLFSGSSGEGGSVGAPLLADGQVLLTQHEVLSNLATDGGLGSTLTTSWWGSIDSDNALYRPLSSFVLGLGAVVSGERYDPSAPGAAAMPFKFLALALKVLAALLVLEVAWRLFRKAGHAAAAALLFAALPVHAGAVFDVAGISVWLGTVLSLGAWALWLEAGEKPQSKPGALLGAALLLFAASLAHELAFMLPLVLFAVDTGSATEGGIGQGVKASMGKLPGLLALIVILAFSLGLRIAVVGGPLPELGADHALGNPLLAEGFLSRFMNGTRLGAESIAVAAGINPLSAGWSYSADYAANQIPVLPAFAWQNLAGVGALIALKLLAVALFGACRTRAGLMLGLVGAFFWMSGALIPGSEMFSERLLVFPSVLLVLFIAPFLGALGKAGLIAAGLVAVASSFWSFDRAAHWTSNKELWKQTIETSPESARAHFEYGLAVLDERALLPLARARFERALELQPEYPRALWALGQAYEAEDNAQAAVEPYTKALELRLEQSEWTWSVERDQRIDGIPALLYLLTQLRAFSGEGQAIEHLAYLEGVAEQGYQSPGLWGRRGDVLRSLGRMDEALDAYDQGIELGGVLGAFEILAYKGRLLNNLGRSDEARAVYQTLADADESAFATLGVGRRADVLLALADLSLLDDSAVALEQVTGLLDSNLLTPYQVLRARLLEAQALLGTGPDGGEAKALREHENRIVRSLQEGMLAATQSALDGDPRAIQSPESDIASELLVPYLQAKGALNAAEALLREILGDRERPTLRARLADLFLRRSQFDAAADQAALAAEGMLRDGVPVNEGIYLETRLIQLLALGASESEEAPEMIEAILAQEQATGRPANLGLVASWKAIDGDFEGSRALLDGLEATSTEGMNFAPLRAVVEQLAGFTAQVESGELEGLELANAQAAISSLSLNLGDKLGCLEAAQASVDADPDADPVAMANRLMTLAKATEVARTPQAAIAVVDRALALEIDDSLREAITAYKQNLEWLTE